MDILAKLRESRKELEGIQVSEPRDWDRIRHGWAAKWRPLVRTAFADHMVDFEELLKPPSWVFIGSETQVRHGDGLFGSYRGPNPSQVAQLNAERAVRIQQKPQQDAQRAADKKGSIINFIDGLSLIVLPTNSALDDVHLHTERSRHMTDDAAQMMDHLKTEYVKAEYPSWQVWEFTPNPESMVIFAELRAHGYVEQTGAHGSPWRLTEDGQQWIMHQLSENRGSSRVVPASAALIAEPPELMPFLEKFRKDHPNPSECVFLMMRFGTTAPHENIVRAVKDGLAKLGKKGLRADDRNYAQQIWPNIQTYLHGCASGLAIFDRIEADEINPNISLECGYMLGVGKPLCLLKDKTLKGLQTDLTGHIYRPFDPHNAEVTVLKCLKEWFRDEGWRVPESLTAD